MDTRPRKDKTNLFRAFTGLVRSFFAHHMHQSSDADERLRKGEETLPLAHKQVTDQEGRVRKLKEDGRDAKLAENLLDTFKETEETHQQVVKALRKDKG